EEIDAALKKVDEEAVSDLRQELKRYFILQKVAELEKIYATEDDVNLQVALLAKAYHRPVKEVLAELEESGRVDTLRAEIRHTKVLRHLREKAKVGKGGQAGASEPAAGQPAADSSTAEGSATAT